MKKKCPKGIKVNAKTESLNFKLTRNSSLVVGLNQDAYKTSMIDSYSKLRKLSDEGGISGTEDLSSCIFRERYRIDFKSINSRHNFNLDSFEFRAGIRIDF